MHPYRMQQLIKERGKDEVINVQQRTSIYQTIDRLERAGLISVAETTREEKWPERTVYQLTEEGRVTTEDWMREMLSTPAREFPELPAALAHLPLLTPEDAAAQLEARIAALETDSAAREARIAAIAPTLPRIFLLEEEYLQAVLRTEAAWIRSVVEDLRAGRLTWSAEWLRSFVSAPSAEGEYPEGETT